MPVCVITIILGGVVLKTRAAVIIISIILVAVLTGCSNQIPVESQTPTAPVTQSISPVPSAPVSETVADYYPIRENVEIVYEGIGIEYAAYNVYIDYTSKNKIQERKNNSGTETVKVIEVANGKVTCIYSQDEAYYRENFLEKESNVQDVLLMEPLVVGTTWTAGNGAVRTITGVSVNVETPSGNYSTISVETVNEYGKITDYYAKDIGLVKTVSAGKDYEVSSSLSEIKQDASFEQTISFYYPNINDSKYYYKNKTVSFNTNDVTRIVLAEAYKEPFDGQPGSVFSRNTRINSLYLNKDGMVYIDLSKEFILEMNAGSGYEAMILKCVANTFGSYYSQSKVILTVDNALYSSGHFEFEKGEYLSAIPEESVEID